MSSTPSIVLNRTKFAAAKSVVNTAPGQLGTANFDSQRKLHQASNVLQRMNSQKSSHRGY